MSASPSPSLSFLASVDLFRGLDEAVLREVARRLQALTLHPGESVLQQGVCPDAAYIVVDGTLAASAAGGRRDKRFLATLTAGESIGCWELLSGDAACADVTAMQTASLLRLARADFDALLRSCPPAVDAMTAAATAQVRRWRLLIALHVNEVFGELDELALRDLANELDLVTLPSGGVLYRRGDAGDAMHVVITGRLRVLAPAEDGEERMVSELGVGEIVGEMALISGEPRAATIRALRDTQLARLSRSRYEEFLARHPQAALQTVARTLVTRLKQQNAGAHRRQMPIRTLAVVPVAPGARASQFAAQLAATLARRGTARHLSSRAVDLALGVAGISQAHEHERYDLRLIEWLGNQEAQHEFVLYETDATLTAWTRRCLRQADHVLVVAEAAGEVGPGEVESYVEEARRSRGGSPRSLVLLRDDGAPAGTGRWLHGRALERHYHVRLGAQPDFDRLARFLRRRAFGLTLGGGFARGLVHIGVLRAFREAGIALDAIGGASMGAIIAAQWALGWDEPTMVRETVKQCSACVVGGMTLPVLSFKSGGRFSRVVQGFFGSAQIEDIAVPFFCVSSNLNRAELKVHRHGSLTKALLASSRVPGVFPPIVYDGELHVDGGIIDNVPVDVMRSFLQGGVVAGVDASPPRVFTQAMDYGYDVPGWRAFWVRNNPFRRRSGWMPNILHVMIRTIEFGGISHNRSAAGTADLFLRPPLDRFERADFTHAQEIVETGYRHACEALERWPLAAELRER